MNWKIIEQHIRNSCSITFKIKSINRLSGGSINQAYKIDDGDQQFFVKLNSPEQLQMFEAEVTGLTELEQSKTISIPKVICYGKCKLVSYLVLEFIQQGAVDSCSHRKLGEQLANMHHTTAERFGLHQNNTIGLTTQRNNPTHNWFDFFREHRLGYQFELAKMNGYKGQIQKTAKILLKNLHIFFQDYTPVPSLLHGDLWSGNYFFDQDNNPVIFDPAVYYGDRETDIAMTELFGGFHTDFYTAYNEAWPLESGYKIRKTLYNLYHILNHLNLFGSSYLGQAENMLSSLVLKIN